MSEVTNTATAAITAATGATVHAQYYAADGPRFDYVQALRHLDAATVAIERARAALLMDPANIPGDTASADVDMPAQVAGEDVLFPPHQPVPAVKVVKRPVDATEGIDEIEVG